MTGDIEACAEDELAHLDLERAGIIRTISVPLLEEDGYPDAVIGTDMVAAWRKADASFERYREDFCENIYLLNSGGTIRGFAKLNCMVRLTQEHIDSLKTALNDAPLPERDAVP